jgi:hypothetical protein
MSRLPSFPPVQNGRVSGVNTGSLRRGGSGVLAVGIICFLPAIPGFAVSGSNNCTVTDNTPVQIARRGRSAIDLLHL